MSKPCVMRLLHWRLGVNLVLCLNPGLTFTVPWLSCWRSWGWLLGKHKIDRWISEKLFCLRFCEDLATKKIRSSPTFHELWGLSADQEPVALTLAEAIYGTLVACGKFISWSHTWRQSLSTLEAALVWTLSTFDGWMYLKRTVFFDLPRWRRNNRMAECLWDDSYLSFVDVFQTEYVPCALLFAARIFVEAGVLAKLMALLISYPLMRGKSLVQASPGGC